MVYQLEWLGKWDWERIKGEVLEPTWPTPNVTHKPKVSRSKLGLATRTHMYICTCIHTYTLYIIYSQETSTKYNHLNTLAPELVLYLCFSIHCVTIKHVFKVVSQYRWMMAYLQIEIEPFITFKDRILFILHMTNGPYWVSHLFCNKVWFTI